MVDKSNGILGKAADLVAGLENIYPDLLLHGVQILDSEVLVGAHYPVFSTSLPLFLLMGPELPCPENLHRLLVKVYPDSTRLYYLQEEQKDKNGWREATLLQICEEDLNITALFIPVSNPGTSMEEFMNLITHLRAPDGCPWDRKQTHSSLRQYLLEETYEALEALDEENYEHLREELGDLLLQIALHAAIGSENGTFTFAEVVAGINQKIISRHPHVFGDTFARDDQEVVSNWEKIKETERSGNGKEGKKGLLDGLPSILPALSQAQSLQTRAARVGFDWPTIAPVLGKVMEELEEVRTSPDAVAQRKELGDVLFAVVNLVRWYGVDAESALRETNQKFKTRFSYIELKARETGRDLQGMSLTEMDSLWEEAKRLDK